MKRSLLPVALLVAFGFGQASQAAKREPITLTFRNDLAVPIEYAHGIKSNPPANAISLITLAPGAEAELQVDMEQFPQLLFREKHAKDIAFIYEFSGKPHYIDVHIAKGPKFEPTPGKEKIKMGAWTRDKKNIGANNIKFVGTSGRADAIKSEPRPYKIDPAAEAKARAKARAEEAEKERFTQRIMNPGKYSSAPAAA
jgi:hypothetical protein